MKKTTSQKIKLGFFVIIGLILFVLAVYFIGDKQKMFGKTNHLSAVFNNVDGLQLGNNVRFSGVNVGTVLEIQMVNDTNIKVDMIIDKNNFKYIKKDAVATIGSDGLVGSMIINILPGGDPSAKPVEPGDVIKSVNRIRTADLLSTLSRTNDNAAQLTENLLKITDEVNNGNGTIGLLLHDIQMAEDLKKSIHYLKISGKETSESLANLNKLIASLSKDKNNVIGVLKDSAVANDIKNVFSNLDKSSAEIDNVISNLNKTILNIKDGNGALNYLANDKKLVTNIDSTMTNITEASKRLNENMEAIRHNFLFRGYFKKLDKKAEKEKGKKKK